MRSQHEVPVDQVVEREGVAKAIGIKHVASVLYTYRCTISCKHCLFNCSPDQPPVRTSHEDGLDFLEQLRATDRVVHIAGGEAMIYYDDLIALWSEANEGGIAPHFFETNASWCTDDEIAMARYRELKESGAKGVLISCDPYHLAHVKIDSFLRARKYAVKEFGRENVITSYATPEELERVRAVGKSEELLAEHVRNGPPNLVGRAGAELSRYLPDRPIEELRYDGLWHPADITDGTCISEFDPNEMWEIHIDPYGNVQTCCGILVGNARQSSLEEMMGSGFAGNEIVRIVRERGPFGLLDLATGLGYEARKGYPQKCNLCWEVRKYLRPHFPDILGPDEIYGPLTEMEGG
ncbi:MAG: radical SAM protein [Theionarchaea archaeon]|nr:radical SAM protein [Theionarchaea archaeon]